MENAPSWWLRLGGRNAISVPAWLFTLVGGTAAAFSWIPDGPNVRAWEWIGLSVVAQMILGCILLGAWLTYLSPRPRPPRTVALMGTLLVAGCVRGAFLSVAGERLQLVEQGYVWQRATGAAMSFAVWFSLATLIVDGWRRHRAIVTRLRTEMLREQELAERSTSLINDFRSTVLEQTQSVLRAGLDSASAASGEPATAAASLRRTVDDLIRPLSHEFERRAVGDAELLADSGREPPESRVPLRTYVRGSFTARPFAPLATAAVIIATPLVVTMHVLGPAVGAMTVLLAGCVVGLSLRTLRVPLMKAIPRWPAVQSAACVIGVWAGVTALVGMLPATLVHLAGPPTEADLATAGLTATGSSMLMLVVTAMGTMVAAAVEGSVEQQHRAAQDQLRSAALAVEWSAARLRQRAWNEQRSLGRLLHGTVQATMVAAAIRLRTQTPGQAAVTMAGLTTRLQYALGDVAETSWRTQGTNLADVWEGAITLGVVMTGPAERALDQDPLAAHSLFQVLNEAVTNAVRHGDANAVQVTVEVEPGYLLLTVMDDGRPVAGGGEGGTGYTIYEANCADWQLAFDSTTTLRARVACRDTLIPAAAGGVE